MSLDNARLALIKTGLDAIVREMAVNIRRSAYSSIVREAKDFSVALTDAKGEVVAQAECIPIMTTGISFALEGLERVIDTGELTSDDALIMNDPYSGGQHLQDVYLFSPIFDEKGRLIGFGATVAHHVDLGGMHAGISPNATEIFHEGLRIPLSRFSVSRDIDHPNGVLRQIIGANVRVPETVLGDLRAQFASNATADRRLHELISRYGLTDCLQAMSDVKDHAEARVRSAFSRIPNGTYGATEVVETDAWGGNTSKVHVAVTVTDDELDIDFNGTDPQITGNINSPLASTKSVAQSGVRCMLDEPDLGFNEGCNRPLTIRAPEGSLLNPKFPAAVRARLTTASRAFNAVVRALGEALPEQAVATGFDTTTATALSDIMEDGNYSVVLEILGGGWGACAEHDGADALDNPISNCANAPIEALEADYAHFRIAEYSLLDGSGGEGATTGGRGIRRVYEATKDGVRVAGYADRHRIGAPGIYGGNNGSRGSFVIERFGGKTETLENIYEAVLNCGDRLVIEAGGGGGYGLSPNRGEMGSA